MIGIFDSGLGGLSVLAAIDPLLPQADLLYFADTAHLPYGEKSPEFIRARVLNIGQHLAAQGCAIIVIACNTATAAAVSALREALPNCVLIGVEPGVKPAALASKSRHIAVLTTSSTARSERLAQLIQTHASQVQVSVLACPGWASKVEAWQLDDADFFAEAQAHLSPALDAGADQIVLGCTHYSFLAPLLKRIVAGRAQLVDVAAAVASQCQRLAGNAEHGSGQLYLQASAHVERLPCAFKALGLQAILARRNFYLSTALQADTKAFENAYQSRSNR